MIKHKNNIGVLRLLMASLVIVSHAAPQVDGDSRREPLLRIFGTLTLGEISVAGFFLLSGYLITMSMDRSPSVTTYMSRRLMRIWPGYFVAALICSLIMGPIVGGTPADAPWTAWLRTSLLLGPVETAGQLQGMPIPVLNGSMWTIPLEFGCYVGVAILWFAGALRRPMLVLGLTFFVGLVCIAVTFELVQKPIATLGHKGLSIFVMGAPLQLAVYFLVGATGYLLRSKIDARVGRSVAGLSAVLWVVSLMTPQTAVVGSAVFGGIVIYWLSFKANFGRLQHINDRWDISYGTYLYGWPIATTLLYFNRGLGPWTLSLLTMPIAWVAGMASWFLVERWAKDLFDARLMSKVIKQNSLQENAS